MPSILVVEQELRYIERITAALTAEGWKVRVVPGRAEALQEAASQAPDLLVASAAIPGVEALAATFSRSAGGPGVVALLPEDAAQAGTGGVEADELLAKPFSGQELSAVVRRVLTARREAPAPQARGDEPKLTSADIFGDMLAEVESAVDEAAPEILPPASAGPARPAASAQSAGSTGGDDEMRRRLEQTLSGVLNTAPRTRPVGKPPAPPTAAPAARRSDAADADLDALINRTLSGLGGSSRPPARPAPPTPAAAITPAITPVVSRTAPGPTVPPPAAVRPAAAVQPPVSIQPQALSAPPAPAPVPAAAAVPSAKPVAAPIVPPAKPAVAPPGPPAPAATEGTGVRKDQRVVGDFDFSEIEELARTRTRTGPAPARPATVPALGSVPAPVPSTVAPAKPPVRVDATTQRIAVIPDGQRPGERFGQYTLLEKIAVGGMAEVWKARMSGVEGFQKTVAIKKILPHLTDNAEFIGMFIDEAKLAAQLSHPNIIHIYDLGKIGRDYYIAMEYVEGKDLRTLLNAGRSRRLPVPPGLAVLIAERLASALDYAHRKRDFEDRELGLVHRDVSPQNVLITSHGDIKLCDFGIAKAVSKASQTQLGALKGKLQYMSPEQAWGKTVDARSDIFSLGAILFELLTGERLFPGDSEMGVLEAVRDGRVRGPREIDPSISPEVEAVVQKALARDPDARFASAGEMQVRLERILQADKPTPTATDLAAYVQSLLAPPAAAPPAVVAPPAPAPPILPEPPAPPAPPGITPFAVPPVLPYAADAPAVLPEAALAEESVPVAAVAGTADEMTPADLAAVAPLGPLTVEDSERRGRLVLWAAIVVLVLLGVAGYFLFGRFKQSPPAPAPAPAVTANPAVPPAVAPATGTQPGSVAAPTPAAAGAGHTDVAGMVDQELAKHEQELKAKYEQEQKRLEKELTLARQNGKPVPPGAAGAPTANTPPPAQETARPTEPEAAPPPAPAPAVVPPPAAEPEAEPEPPAAARAAEPPPAVKARLGDLVTGGPGVSPPVLVSSQQPGYPPIARKMKVEGTVVVSVLVDENGRVQDAKLAEPLKRDFGINQAALEVARTARYRPATKDGARVKMWIRLKIPFKL